MYFSIYNRLGLHVGASNRDVVRAARGILSAKAQASRTRYARQARCAFYRKILDQHAGARKLYNQVQRGMI